MRGNAFFGEIVVSVLLVALLALFLNPLGFWMPTALVMMMITALIIGVAAFAGFVWREQARDEREGLHRMLAGRAAYLAGSGVLAVGIILQSIAHALDPWLVIALAAMILAKVAGLIYGRVRH